MAESEDIKTKSGSRPGAKPGAKSGLGETRGETRRKPDEDPVGKVYDAYLMRRLSRFVRPYWLEAGIASLAVTLKSLCDVAGPILVMVAVDRYLAPDVAAQDPSNAVAHWVANASPLARLLPAGAWQGVTRLAAIYLTMLVSAYLFQFVQVYLMQWTGQKIMFDLRRDIFRHMQRMHVGFFDVNPVGRLVTRIFRDHVRESFRRVRTAIARINSFTQEHISGMSVVQLFNREARAYKDFEAVNRQHMIAFKDTILAYALYYPAVDFLSSVAIALVVWRGGFGVLHLPPTVTIGVLIMFTQFSLRFWRPIQDLSDKYNILQSAMAACERIFKLMDSAPEIVSPAHAVAGDASNRIEFRHVWFTYQKLTDAQKAAVAKAEQSAADGAELAGLDNIEWILRDVSFTIEPGQTVAIVGHTGAGKTTLTSLMMRFYEVTSGRILIDGVDLRDHDLTALRRHFAVVLQDPFLFSGTIGENIRLGNEEITDATMRHAARDVNVLDFIESLPNGFDEPVRERGNSLSTGQKQLINFARALAYNPRILILDEATSSVDTDTELRIRGALERMVEGRTSVLIAHRLSTVQRAETILVMHKGQLREMGSHQELLAHRGLYWKLYQLQYKDQESGVLAPPSREPSAAPAV